MSTIKYTEGFFTSHEGDRIYGETAFANAFDSIISTGVLPASDDYGDFELTASDNIVTIGTGRAWISGHFYCHDAISTIEVDDSCYIILRLDTEEREFALEAVTSLDSYDSDLYILLGRWTGSKIISYTPSGSASSTGNCPIAQFRGEGASSGSTSTESLIDGMDVVV